MEFDKCSHFSYSDCWWWDDEDRLIREERAKKDKDKLFSSIAQMWEDAGYQLPKLIFWNVCSKTRTVPINENSNGVILVGGFSKNLLDMVMTGELDAEKALIKTLNGERYAAIKNEYEKNI